MVVLAACGDRLETKEKVQETIMARLERTSGLDLKSLDVNTTSVTFDKNLAYATVAFHPKNDPSVNSGMTMKYTLEKRDGKWAVINVTDSQGHGMPGHPRAGDEQLPAGHPPVDAAGHAPVDGAAPGQTR